MYGDKVDGTQRPYAFVGFGESSLFVLSFFLEVRAWGG